MSRIIAGCALAALLLSPAGAQAPAEEQPDDNVKICKKESAPTGSRLGARKICATKKEWALLDAPTHETRMNIKRIQEVRGCGGSDCGGNKTSLGGRY